jgi:hypothetical protein
MKFNLFALKQRLELSKEKEYSWEAIARATGLHAHTVRGMAFNRKGGADLDTLNRVVKFFREEGMDVGIEDLIIEGELMPAGGSAG